MKKITAVIAILFALLTVFSLNTTKAENTTQVGQAQSLKNIDLLPAYESQSNVPNRIWVGTFSLAWNELMEEYVKKPIKFAGVQSENAKLLNKKTFRASAINSESYYIKSGPVSPELRDEIENGIKTKFKESSDILKIFDWSENPQKLFIYAMLKKDFKFLVPFDKLSESYFGKNHKPISYFGINNKSSHRLYANVNVMFYNDYNNFAVKLLTRARDTVILYRTDEDTTFDKYYEQLMEDYSKYQGVRRFTSDDKLRIPDFDIYVETNFPEFEGRRIKGTDLVIDRTIETVDFKMNKEGVKLKSEAAISATFTSLMPEKGRNFSFDDSFVLFLVEKNKQIPYYAMRVNDVEAFNKTKNKKKF